MTNLGESRIQGAVGGDESGVMVDGVREEDGLVAGVDARVVGESADVQQGVVGQLPSPVLSGGQGSRGWRCGCDHAAT